MEETAAFRACFEQAATGIAVAGADGRIIQVNHALCLMLGCDADGLKSLGLKQLMASGHRLPLMALIQEISDGGRMRGRITLECRVPGGRGIRSLVHVSMVEAAAAADRRFLLQFQDISSLIRTEAELEGSRQRYRALADATFEAVFISRNGICIDANRTASTMFATPREELIGIFGTDVIAPEYKALVKRNMLAGHESPYRAVAVKKNGQRFHVMIQGKMTRIGGKDVRVTVVRDIDDQIKAEAALKENERHLRSIIDNAANFVLFRMRHNPSNPCLPQRILISPSIDQLVDRTQVVDFQSWLAMIHPEDRELLQAAGRKMLTSHRLEERIRIADRAGEGWRWLHIICAAVSEADGGLFFNGIILDIDREMKATAALKARERELKERSESLAEVNTALEVLLRKREADRLEMEDKMLSNAKGLILPYLEKLKSSRLDDRQRLYLDLVETNLNEIISPLYRQMSRQYLSFTPHEIQVANLVKAGKNTKEIATVMGLSVRTIEAVRYTIRRKLGIKKKRANLRSHLLAIDRSVSIAENI